jgi:hypothetical protein
MVHHLFKKFSILFTWCFIAVLTRAIHWSRSSVTHNQICLFLTLTPCSVDIILVLFSHLRLDLARVFFDHDFRPEPYTISYRSHPCYIPCPYPTWFVRLSIWPIVLQILDSSFALFFQFPVTWFLLGPRILTTLFSNTFGTRMGHTCFPYSKDPCFIPKRTGLIIDSSSSAAYGSTAHFGPWPPLMGFHNSNLYTGLDC